MHTNYALFEAYDETFYTKIFFDAETGGFVVAHKKHGKQELEGNKRIALMLIKHGYSIVLQPNKNEGKSADATLDDEVWEFKRVWDTMNLGNRVQKTIQEGKPQARNILVFIDQVYTFKEIIKGIYGAIKFDSKQKIRKIGIILPNGHLIIIERAEVLDDSFLNKFPED